MELREIEIFLVLTGELHFGRTAERLYLSQSRVSQTIRRLEERFGGRLFDRTSRTVRLTPLGEQLRDDLRPVFEEFARVMEVTRDSAGGVAGELLVGLYSFGSVPPWFDRIVRVFEERHPRCRVIVRERTTIDGLAGLRRGDLHLLANFLPLDEPDLTMGPTLGRVDRALAVREGHPLAERGYATLEDLADHCFIDNRALPQPLLDVFFPPSAPSGRRIERRYPATRLLEMLDLVARGLVVHPTVESLLTYAAFPGVTVIPLHGLPPIEMALVWRTKARTPAIGSFVEVAEEIRAEQAHR